MRFWPIIMLLPLCAILTTGCGRAKTTDELIEGLESPDEKIRTESLRKLSAKKEDAARIVPVLIEKLKSRDAEVRRDAANQLGYFGDKASAAIPALKELAEKDTNPRVKNSARSALTLIEK